jgi:hypothetical protein
VCVSSIAVLWVIGPDARAQEAWGGAAASIVPLEETPTLRLPSMDVLLDETVGEAATWWRVVAVYRVESTSPQASRTWIGIPELRCAREEGATCFADPVLRDERVRVRGVEAAPSDIDGGSALVAKLEPDWLHMNRKLGRMRAVEVGFAPREAVEIVHTFEVRASKRARLRIAEVVMAPARVFRGPIGRARFRVRLRPWWWYFEVPAVFRVLEPEEAPRAREAADRIELVFEAKDWSPNEAFEVVFGSAEPPPELRERAVSDAPLGRCPDIIEVARASDYGAIDLPLPLVKGLPDDLLRWCHLLPFARRGYPFQAEEVRAHFYRRPVRLEQSFHFGAERPSFVGFYRENPFFDAATLTREERGYARTLAAEMLRRPSVAHLAREGPNVDEPLGDGGASKRKPEGRCGCTGGEWTLAAVVALLVGAWWLLDRRAARRRRKARRK